MSSTLTRSTRKCEASGPAVRDVVGSKGLWILTIAAGSALLAAYRPAFEFWWSRWFQQDSYYSHGIFVPLASIFIIWFERKRLASAPVRPAVWGYPVLIAAALVGWLAWMGASASVMGFTLPLFLAGAVAAVLGPAVLYRTAFPIGFLYFGTVLPESLLTALSFKAQMLSVKLGTAGLGLLGVHAVSRGAFIDLPRLTVEVGSGCSGFRLAVAMLAIGAFFAYIRRGPLAGRLALVAFALPLGLLVNSVRVVVVALVGQVWGDAALRSAHDTAGFAVLIAGVGSLLLFARLVGCGKYREMPSR